MTLTPLDHWLFAVLVFGLPIEGAMEFRELVAAIRRNQPRARSLALRRTIIMQWALTGTLLAGWASAARPWGLIGLQWSFGWQNLVGVVGLAAAVLLVILQYRGIRSLAPEQRAGLRERIGDSLLLLPTTSDERRIFAAASITAGFCEEVLIRGFLFWYLGQWIPAWAIVPAASALFGVMHVYQGAKGALRTAIVGAFLGVLYLASGTLLWPILAHAAIDLGAGALSRLFSTSIEPDSRSGVDR